MPEIRALTVHLAGTWTPGQAADEISLTYDERHRRRFAFTADGGTSFLLDLPRATVLNDGDGLELEDGKLIAVKAAPESITKITGHHPGDLVQLAWHIGNRHLPAQLTGDAIYIREDHVISHMLEGLGAHIHHIKAPFTPESGAYSGGGHSHSHGIMRGMIMTDPLSLQKLLAWTSPAYPIGAFTYSHGLEAAVEDGRVKTADQLYDYVHAALSGGGIWVDAVLFAQTYDCWENETALNDLADLAAAFRASSETALESHQQGKSFLSITRKAWPHPALDALAEHRGARPIAHCIALGLASACHGIERGMALDSYLHSSAANLVSAGVRVIPLGQTDGQIATAKLSAECANIAVRAIAASLDDLGTSAIQVDLACLAHETQYTRLFRS